MSLLDAMQDSQATYARGLKEGIAIGKREQAAAMTILTEGLHRILSMNYSEYRESALQNAQFFAASALDLVEKGIVPPSESHDDKQDGRPDMHVSTSPSDLGADWKAVIR